MVRVAHRRLSADERRVRGGHAVRPDDPGGPRLHGARLSAAETVVFSTPRPKLARASYELDDAAPVPPKPRVDI